MLAVFVALVLTPILTNADPVRKQDLDISAQPLADALKVIAERFSLKIVFFTDDTKGIDTLPLIGNFSAPQAFDALLAETALEHTYVNSSSVAIRLRSQSEPIGRHELEPDGNIAMGDNKKNTSGFFVAMIAAVFGGGADNAVSQSVGIASSGAIEEIIVTSRKRSETLQDVPIAVNVLSKDLIDSLRITDIQSLASAVPGLQIADQTGGTGGGLVALRGVANGDNGVLIDQAVAINIDGAPINDARFLHGSLFDLRQVEVMRGPQALFYGKNSPGGVIALHTNDPGDNFELVLSAEYESQAKERVGKFIISGPLSDTVGARLAMSYSKQDGLFDVISTPEFPVGTNEFPNREDLFVIGTLVYEPNDDLKVRLKANYFDREIKGGWQWATQRILCPLGAPQARAPLDDCKADGTVYNTGIHPAAAAYSSDFASSTPDGEHRTEAFVGSLTVDYHLPDSSLSLTSVTTFFDLENFVSGDLSWEPTPLLQSTNPSEIDQFTQEFRLASEFEGNFNFTMGGFYEDGDRGMLIDTLLTPVFFGGAFGPDFTLALGAQEYSQSTTSWSVFFEGEWDISDKITLSGGARYTDEEKEIDKYTFRGVSVMDLIVKDKEQWGNLSPEVSLQYKYTDSVMFFAGYRSGFKSGGFDGAFKAPAINVGAPLDLLYEEEGIEGFEGGMKARFLDDTLTLNVTAFAYDYEDLQLSILESESIVVRVVNAAEASVEGLEIDTVWATPVAGLTLRGNLNFLNAEFTEFLGDCYTGQTIALGCNQALDTGTGLFTKQVLDGKPLQNAPDFAGSIGFEFITPLSDGLNIAVTGFASYQDETGTTPTFVPNSGQDSYSLINASVSLYSADNKWTVYLKGTNLGDEYYNMKSADVAFTGAGKGGVTATPADQLGAVRGGRRVTFGVTFRY
ncbi:MAG: TonB-dependent receptor [Luminiphilus sp.]|nr:TonB-dependent receptor [Luminiphilus sp.]